MAEGQVAPLQEVIQQHTVITQPTQVVGIEPVPVVPFSLEPVALLLVLGLFVWMLVWRRRRRAAVWPVPSLLGLEAAYPKAQPAPEPLNLPELESVHLDDEQALPASDADAERQSREEELELVV